MNPLLQPVLRSTVVFPLIYLPIIVRRPRTGSAAPSRKAPRPYGLYLAAEDEGAGLEMELLGATVLWKGFGKPGATNGRPRCVRPHSVLLSAGPVVVQLLSSADEQSFAILRVQGVR